MSTRRSDWGKIFRVAATTGFVASALLHLATFTSFPPARAAAFALVLFVGAFALLALIPEGPRRAALAVIGYVLMNLVLSLLLLGDEGIGSVRLLSGHLLLFYLIPLMYFRFVEPRLRDGGKPPHP